MKQGEERGDAQCAGLRVRCLASGQKVFFYRYRARDGVLREIRLGEVGPLTLAKARDAAVRKRLDRGDKKAQDPIEVPWTVHDLRRTVATGLAKLGCPRVVQDRILNHVDSSVGAI